MPDINPAMIPTINPGQLFEEFTTDDTLNIRWIMPTDPVLFEAANRPIADVVVRQLIIAKAIDNIELRLSHMALFPFLTACKVISGSGEIELPLSWIWDMHTSVPAKWEYLRLAKIKRISGTNGTGASDPITGTLRLIFTAQAQGSATEVALFSADYRIDSPLTYQVIRIVACTSAEEPIPIDPAEVATVNGWLIFRTLDTSDATNRDFFVHLAPPTGGTVDSEGIYSTPAVYEIAATVGSEFLASALIHGTGVLVSSAFNAIPATDSDFATWLSSNNYPFRIGSTRTSLEGIQVPQALFNEFSMVVPAADEATGDTSMLASPVWLSSIERVDTLANQLRFVFSTYTIVDDGNPGSIVEFAAITLQRTYTSGRVVAIEPINNLLRATGTDAANYNQMFGAGHVTLGSVWGATTTEVSDFFDSFLTLVTSNKATFTKDSGRLSAYALARSSRYIPTKGQWDALRGSSSRLSTPKGPSDSNRFVTEADQGQGDAVDFRLITGIVENPDIEPIGYSGSLVHKAVALIVDANGANHDYTRDILPRLRCLLGRDPVIFDIWWDGTLFKMYTGDAWVTL